LPSAERHPHILLRDRAEAKQYGYPGGGGGDKKLPPRQRTAHAARLRSELDRLRSEALAHRQKATALRLPARQGVYLELESEPGFELELQSLDSRREEGMKLVAVRPSPDREDTTLATVFVPDGELKTFERKIRKYAEKDSRGGRPSHQALIETIAHIRLATLRSFWTDEDELLPAPGEAIWWEIWLRAPEQELFTSFQQAAETLGIEIGTRSLQFVSTRVLLAYGTLEQLADSVEVVDSIAELRRAKELASVFMQLPRREMGEWVENLLRRTQPPPSDAPSICLLDTGVNRGHPLLQAAIDPADLQAVDPAWGVDDREGHGTGMAGLALYGDLTAALAGSFSVELPAWLESVKILPPPPRINHPDLHGEITRQATYRAEVEGPGRSRVYLMAVTARDGRDRGRPSSWSAAVDQLAYGGDGEPRRLWVLAAGNSDPQARNNYPDALETEEIHDPGQAWNALTVGAYTELWQVVERDFDGWEPVAGPGELSPSTTTSGTWTRTDWPLKPDVVFEGGNAARSPAGEIDTPDSLSLLTTHHRPGERLLSTFGDTSAASTQAARMAATLKGRYPDLWPETIRALIVHSALWTNAMRDRYGPLKTKTDYEHLIRHCGFGAPSLEKALWSADNRLTLIAQEAFQPFIHKEKGGNAVFKDMHLYKLPWPVEELQQLGEVEVELRVTLSYFIEPNPSERGHKVRHRYASHGLRFDVRGATETPEQFHKRLNKSAREDGERSPGTGDGQQWLVGSANRHKGSLHCDLWRGTAADLASRRHLAVYPVAGWWKERPRLERWKRKARYSLVVSIQSPEVEVDLYTPVLQQISTAIEI